MGQLIPTNKTPLFFISVLECSLLPAIKNLLEANKFSQSEFQAITFALGKAKKRIKIKSCNLDNIYQYFIDYMNKIVPFNLEIMKENSEQIKSVFDNNIFKLFHYSNWKVNSHNLTLDMINALAVPL